MDASTRPALGARLLIAALAALVLVAVGCTDGDNEPEAGDTTGQNGATDGATDGDARSGLAAVPELVADLAPSVVAIAVSAEESGGQGSGVIVDADGVVVTNDHVVAGADEIEVVLADGSREPGRVEATDVLTDLAVVRIDRTGLPAAELADTLPDVGELVVSIGTPLGFQNTVTAGIVSGLQRSIPQSASRAGQALVDLIQTDAAISPGSSGGALVGRDGALVGINVAYIPPQAGAVALGFAIPSPTVTDVVAELLEDGVAEHPYLGVQVANLTPQLVERFGLEEDRGVLAVEIETDGPAALAGLEPGDVVVALDGSQVGDVGAFLTELRGHEPDEEVSLAIVRDGERQDLAVTIGERPPARL